MRKNYLIYIFVFIICLFVLDNNVYAEQSTGDSSDSSTDVFLFEPDGYDQTCIYYANFGLGPFNVIKSQKNITQISWKNDGTMKVMDIFMDTPLADCSLEFNLDDVKEVYGDAVCPITIYFPRNAFKVSFSRKYYLSKGNFSRNWGNGAVTMNLIDEYPEQDRKEIPKILKDKSQNYSCDDIITGDARDILNGIITLIRVAVPIILVAMGVYDFGSAVFAGDEDKMKKAQSRFIKRLIIAVAFFLIPVFLRFILEIAYQIWGVVDPTLCGLI